MAVLPLLLDLEELYRYLEAGETPDRFLIWDEGTYFEVPLDTLGHLEGFTNNEFHELPIIEVFEKDIIKPILGDG